MTTAVSQHHEAVREALLEAASSGSQRLPEIVQAVAMKTKTDPEVVVTTIWELVDENRLTYGADAIPKLLK